MSMSSYISASRLESINCLYSNRPIELGTHMQQLKGVSHNENMDILTQHITRWSVTRITCLYLHNICSWDEKVALYETIIFLLSSTFIVDEEITKTMIFNQKHIFH